MKVRKAPQKLALLVLALVLATTLTAANTRADTTAPPWLGNGTVAPNGTSHQSQGPAPAAEAPLTAPAEMSLQGQAPEAAGEAPQTAPTEISLQGRLVDPATGAPKPDATYAMTFKLYDSATGVTALWTESQNVAVAGGLYSVYLGRVTALNPAHFDGRALWLGITIPPDSEATPRLQIGYVPYAYYAGNAQTLGGQPASYYAQSGHKHIGADITSGTVGTNYYSAYADLVAESKVGTASGQVAAGNHNHDSAYVNIAGDTMSGTLAVVTSTSHGVSAITTSTAAGAAGVEGKNNGAGYGVYAYGAANYGAYGATSSSSLGMSGVYGLAGASSGLNLSRTAGVKGDSSSGFGVAGISNGAVGVFGQSNADKGVEGDGYTIGVFGYGYAASPTTSYGIYGYNTSASGWAGYFNGDVHVVGDFSATGAKTFKIDHPLDPANEYLYHYSVESPEVRNLYDGVAVLDQGGEAVVTLPDYFSALNSPEGYRYQLTCIGGYAPVYIAEEISGNQFKVAGGKAGLKVSWQVTALRNDPYMRDHPAQAEQPKADNERGTYLYPEGYGQPENMTPDHGRTLPQRLAQPATQ